MKINAQRVTLYSHHFPTPVVLTLEPEVVDNLIDSIDNHITFSGEDVKGNYIHFNKEFLRDVGIVVSPEFEFTP